MFRSSKNCRHAIQKTSVKAHIPVITVIVPKPRPLVAAARPRAMLIMTHAASSIQVASCSARKWLLGRGESPFLPLGNLSRLPFSS